MKTISYEDIQALEIPNAKYIEWVEQAFIGKSESFLPHKISQTFNEGRNFYNTMPAIIPALDIAGVKIVSRYPDRTPSIMGEMLIYKLSTGEPLALMDATWITAKRTGAVAALAVKTFAKQGFSSIALMGLGQTGTCFLDMFLADPANQYKEIKLLNYKDHALNTRDYLLSQGCKNITICNDHKSLICESDVIVSAITVAEQQIAEDSWFKEGCLLVPIHTRGFQNCDLFFDKVFADDT